VPVYATIFSFASLLGWFDPASSFLRGLNQEWLSDVQEFLHKGLPKLLFIGITVWILILVVNFITISWLELMSEMYAFGEKNGVDAALVHDMLVWVFDRPGLRNYAAVIRDRNFDEVGFELSTGFKDVQLMLEAATEPLDGAPPEAPGRPAFPDSPLAPACLRPPLWSTVTTTSSTYTVVFFPQVVFTGRLIGEHAGRPGR